MKKILIISYHYHPDLAVGALRAVKFAKYLPENGWEPVILTVNSKYHAQVDDSKPNNTRTVYRTNKLPLPDDIYLKLKSIFRSNKSSKNKPNFANSVGGDNLDDPSKRTPLWKRFIFSLSNTPDNKIGWIFPAVLKGFKIIKEENIDVIYSSGPPWTCHIIGLFLNLFTNIKWVTDFRDPWTLTKKDEQFETLISQKFEKIVEKKVIRSSQLILTTTEEFKLLLEENYPTESKNKCCAIINGFDMDDFAGVKKIGSSSQQIVILHAGTMYSGRDPFNLFIAIGKLLEENYITYDDIMLKFLGNVEISTGRIKSVIEQYKLEPIIKILPSVPRKVYLQEIMNADILLLMQSAQNQTQIPAKTFEYLATGNQILALVDSRATNNILKNHDTATSIPSEDSNKILEVLKEMITRIKNKEDTETQSTLNFDNISKKHLTKLLAEKLNALN